MKVVIDNGKDFKSLLNTGEKCVSDLSGGCLAVKCVQIVCAKDPDNSQGKGILKIIAYKEGLCSLVGVMEDVLVSRDGDVFIDKHTIGELLEALSVVDSNNALITLQRPQGKDLEINIKDYGGKKLGVVSNEDTGETIKFPISGLNSPGKDWKEVFKDTNGKLIEKFIKISSHVNKQDEFIELRIEEILPGFNHHELSLNMRLVGGNTLKYITHIEMSDDQYKQYVGNSFRISTKLKDIISIFKSGFTFSICGDKDQIYRFNNTKGDTLTFFPCTTLVTPSTQIDTCVKDPDTLLSMDVELDRFITALKFHMPENTGGDVELSINNDYLQVKGANSLSPAKIQLHSMKSYGDGWKDLIINVKPLISGGQSILNILSSCSNVMVHVVPFKKNSRDVVNTHRVIVMEPYAEFEGGSPTLLISASIKDISDTELDN